MLAHIGHMPSALIAFCAAQRIVTEAYSPIAHGEAVKDPTVAAVAENTGVSAAQLCIKYVLQHGLVALPKASSRAHIRDNAALAFTISPEDMARLDALDFHGHGEYSFFPVFSGK